MVRARGMTLLELAVAVTVLALIAAAVLPVINGATDVYAATRDAREASTRVSYAADRLTRLVREAPVGVAAGSVGIAVAAEDEILLSDGRGVRLIDGALEMSAGSGYELLCAEVDVFSLEYIGADGSSDAAASPGTVRSVRYSIVSGGFELRGVAAPRVWMTQ